jgi:hypothetical protein
MDMLITLLIAYGICFGMMNKKLPGLSEWFIARQWRVEGEGDDKTTFFGRMFVCPFCTGFHAGWLAWILTQATRIDWTLLHLSSIPSVCGDVVGYALASAAFCYVADTFAQWLEDTGAWAVSQSNED